MLKLFAKFIGSLIRSLFVSILMMVIVYSVITGDFPPSISKAKTTWNNLIKLSHLREDTVYKLAEQGNKTVSEDGEEWDVNVLETFNSERSKLALGLLSDQKKSDTISFFSRPDQDQIRRIQELEVQLYKLQQRVNELEAQMNKSNQ